MTEILKNNLKLEFTVTHNLSGKEKKLSVLDWDAFIQYNFANDFTLGTPMEKDWTGNPIPRFEIPFGFDFQKSKQLVGDDRVKYLEQFVSRKHLDDFKNEIKRNVLDVVNSKRENSSPYLYESGEWYLGFLVDYKGFWVPVEFFLVTDRIPNLCCCFRFIEGSSADGSFLFGKAVSEKEIFDIRKRRFWFEKGWSYHLNRPQI